MSDMTHRRWMQIDRLQWAKARKNFPTANMLQLRRQLTKSMIATHGPCPPKPAPPWYLSLGARVFGGGAGVKRISQVFDWLNGKKTLIGSILVGIPVIWDAVSRILVAGGVEDERVIAIGAILLLVVGWAHKLLKVFGVMKPAPVKGG